MKTSLTRRLLGGVLAVLLVSGVACKQPPSVQAPAQTETAPTAPTDVAALRVKANAGDADAQHKLGVSYDNGQGVPQDFTQAVGWYRKAAEQNNAVAQSLLGTMYQYGQGVPQDYVESHKWFNLAASRVSAEKQKEYAEGRDAVAALMTPAQLAEAQTLAREWLAAFQKRGGK